MIKKMKTVWKINVTKWSNLYNFVLLSLMNANQTDRPGDAKLRDSAAAIVSTQLNCDHLKSIGIQIVSTFN